MNPSKASQESTPVSVDCGGLGKGQDKRMNCWLGLLSLLSCNNPLTESEEPSPQRLDNEEDSIA